MFPIINDNGAKKLIWNGTIIFVEAAAVKVHNNEKL